MSTGLKKNLEDRINAPVLQPVKFDYSQVNAGTGTIQIGKPTNNELTKTRTPTDINNWNIGLVVTSMGDALGGGTVARGDIKALKVWGSVWNDYADFQLLCDELIPGKCYIDTADGAKLCSERCQLSVIGIASDTFGSAVGLVEDQRQVPIAVAGWVLAYVDKEYPCGTPLTNDENGNLTEMTLEEKRNFPERLVATYKRKELDKEFGPEDQKVAVNQRHWVKVK